MNIKRQILIFSLILSLVIKPDKLDINFINTKEDLRILLEIKNDSTLEDAKVRFTDFNNYDELFKIINFDSSFKYNVLGLYVDYDNSNSKNMIYCAKVIITTEINTTYYIIMKYTDNKLKDIKIM